MMNSAEERKRRQEVHDAMLALTSDMFDPRVGLLCDELTRLYKVLAEVDIQCRGALMYEGADWGYQYSVQHSVESVCSRVKL